MSYFCGQLKLYAGDNKKYLSDVINENGVRQLPTIIPSKYKKEIQDWMSGILDPLDAQSKRKAYQLYKTELIHEEEIGKTISLQKIHGYLFEGLYPFARQIRTKTLFCLIDQLRRNIFMKKRYTIMFFTILLTGCEKVNMVKGICLEVDVCPSTYIYYETLEKIKVSESAILETKIVGYFKDNGGMSFEVLNDLTADELDFYIKIDTEKNVYTYKLNDEEKVGIFYGVKVDERTEWYTVEHTFQIPGTDFDSKEKVENLLSFVAVLRSDDLEVRLLSNTLYSRLTMKTIVFSNQ